ncbi:MAG: glutaredoxin [Firmicutes bacterium HGW-Firmicutes-7]|nr:MAG: glutaredoxin [Firmicutes bacterium HGW-Firmicutes-7]
MKITMYGTEICPDCVVAKQQMKENHNIELDYRNITEEISTLKEFLAYRDQEEIFAPVIAAGKIGIPFFILEDETKTFDISNYIEIKKTDLEKHVNACSLDGRGQC